MKIVEFTAYGVPVAKGSAKAFYNRHSGRVIVTQTNRDKQKPWASCIAMAALPHFPAPLSGPVALKAYFVMPRPKSHSGRKGLKPAAPRWHTSKPDCDKLLRCLKDALTAVAWNDDSQVCIVDTRKSYGERPGVEIEIKELEAQSGN